MTRFRDGELDVLVGTTVVEVGVDVPEATMMVIEGADRFGLAQLHQLRGRVGRGTVESYCVLVSDTTDEAARARLKAVAEIRDGFELAERDFELRREGDVLGLAQSGLPRLRVASLQDRDAPASSRSGPARTPRRCSTPRGALHDGAGALRHELERRLAAAGLAAGEPAERTQRRRWLTPGRVIAGTARGIRLAGARARARGRWATG